MICGAERIEATWQAVFVRTLAVVCMCGTIFQGRFTEWLDLLQDCIKRCHLWRRNAPVASQDVPRVAASHSFRFIRRFEDACLHISRNGGMITRGRFLLIIPLTESTLLLKVKEFISQPPLSKKLTGLFNKALKLLFSLMIGTDVRNEMLDKTVYFSEKGSWI